MSKTPDHDFHCACPICVAKMRNTIRDLETRLAAAYARIAQLEETLRAYDAMAK